MNLFLTREAVDKLNYLECIAHLKQLTKAYNINRPIKDWFESAWPIVDDVANTLLLLEDRIRQFEDPRIPSMDPGMEIVKPPPVRYVKPKKVVRKFRVEDVIYDNIHAAARAIGVKTHTLQNYISRSPERYAYVDLDLDHKDSTADSDE